MGARNNERGPPGRGETVVQHVIDQPLEAGYFMSQRWNRSNDQLPTTEQLVMIEPWSGGSISAFWRSVQDDGQLLSH